MAAQLTKDGVSVTMIADSYIASVMQKVDLVLFGAVAIVENGGLLNKVRSRFRQHFSFSPCWSVHIKLALSLRP